MSLIVNGETIDQSLVDQEFSSIKAYYEGLAQVSCCERDDEFLGYAKENVIKRVLLAQEAQKGNIPVLKKEVDAALDKMKEEEGGEAAFYAHTGISEEGEKLLRKDLGAKIQLDKFLDDICGKDPEPDEADIRAYYEKHLEDFMTEEEVRASHLFKSLRKSEARDELYEELRELRRRAQAGEDFDALAREHSDKPEEEIDLGFFKRGEHMDEFETIAFSMDVGEVSPIFSTHWGFHLAKVTGRKPPAARDFDEIQEALREIMIQEHRQEKVQAMASELKQSAKIIDEEPETAPAES
jgi:parvulin-like peptidyl-prolyl isomerase